MRLYDRAAGAAKSKLRQIDPGPERRRVLLLLAAVLALDSADKGTIAATADNLKHAFGIGNTQVGLLLTVVSIASALATLPIGIMTDRINRTRLLAASVVLWAVAMFFSGAAQSFGWLIISRAALGAVAGTAGPTIASLVGDFFPVAERARMIGIILSGDLIGTGFGFVVSGNLASSLGWRFAFWWLIIPAVILVWFLWRLPEPVRGGAGQLSGTAGGEQPVVGQEENLARAAVREQGVQPEPDLVLHQDPRDKSLWWAVKYVLRIRTNLVIIVASALGYFYFAGLRAFAIIYVMDHFQIGKSQASSLVVVLGLGAIAGVLTGGRLADRLLRQGRVAARALVPSVALLAVSFVLAPALVSTSLWLSVGLLVIGAGLLGSANPPLDAARLDILHPYLWGRGEAVRTVLRTVGEAAAPPLFGYFSSRIFGGGSTGLEYTFLIFLVSLLAAGVLAFISLRTYPRDVATAAASLEKVH